MLSLNWRWAGMMGQRLAACASGPVVALAACTAANPDNLPGFFGLQTKIQLYYDHRAVEMDASCLDPELLAVTRAGVVDDDQGQLTLTVSYAWSDSRFGGSHGSGGSHGGHSGAGSCSGFSERQFRVARRPGGGYAVLSMDGEQRR